MKAKFLSLICSAVLTGLLFMPSFASAKTTVIIASSVDTNEQNYFKRNLQQICRTCAAIFQQRF